MLAILFSFLTLIGLNHANIKIEHTWMRPAAKGMNSAMYFKVENHSSKPDTLYKVSSKVAELVQVHETFMKNGLMGMREVKFIVVPADSSIIFKPGGYHVMFIKLKKNLKVKSKVEATVYFKTEGKIKVNALVRTQ